MVSFVRVGSVSRANHATCRHIRAAHTSPRRLPASGGKRRSTHVRLDFTPIGEAPHPVELSKTARESLDVTDGGPTVRFPRLHHQSTAPEAPLMPAPPSRLARRFLLPHLSRTVLRLSADKSTPYGTETPPHVANVLGRPQSKMFVVEHGAFAGHSPVDVAGSQSCA